MRKATVIGLWALMALSVYGVESSRTASAAVTAPVNGDIGFAAAAYPVNQSAGSVILSVQRRTASKGAMSVTYSTTNETAVAGTNYTAESGTLNWADGDGSTKTLTIPVNSKNVFTGTKYFVVRLVAGPNTLLGTHTGTTVTITGGTSTAPPPPPTGYITFPDNLPAAGSSGTDAVPSGAGLVDTSHPTHVIGNGTAASCTSAALVAAVKVGGIITFECGSSPVTIQMTQTAELFNNGAAVTVIDGRGLVTLSGMKQRRILYMSTCDESLVWTSSHCDNQEYPQLTVQNLTFVSGNSAGTSSLEGGAIYALGGRLKVVNSRFFSNVCATGNSGYLYGGAIAAFEQYQSLPLYVVHSTFGGESAYGNTCNDGGALGSIGVTWDIVNSVVSYNHATQGGALYVDGTGETLSINGSQLEDNTATAYGSGIFYVSHPSGALAITDSTMKGNTGGTWYNQYPGISTETYDTVTVKNSSITN